jgi:putative transposase
VYLQAFSNGWELQKAIKDWMGFYNHTRPHATFAGQTPAEMYNFSDSNMMIGVYPNHHIEHKLAA